MKKKEYSYFDTYLYSDDIVGMFGNEKGRCTELCKSDTGCGI